MLKSTSQHPHEVSALQLKCKCKVSVQLLNCNIRINFRVNSNKILTQVQYLNTCTKKLTRNIHLHEIIHF